MRKLLALVYGWLAYGIGTFSLVAMIYFLGNWSRSFGIDYGNPKPLALALFINIGLFVMWSIQHIGMARPAFKRVLTQFIPPAFERSTYVLLTGLTLILLIGLWVPMPAIMFSVTEPIFRSLIVALSFVGWILALAGIFHDSYWEFMGLKQIWSYLRGVAFTPAWFKADWVFRLCRRPTFFGVLLGCWATPDLTVGHALFAVAMTIFTLLGCVFVERSYVDAYGDAYRNVQKSKPLLLPIGKRFGGD